MKPAVEAKVNIMFEPANLRDTQYNGWIAERMQINVEKRLLTLDLDIILEPFENRPGKQWWSGEHIGKYLHAATYAWWFTGDDRVGLFDFFVSCASSYHVFPFLPGFFNCNCG